MSVRSAYAASRLAHVLLRFRWTVLLDLVQTEVWCVASASHTSGNRSVTPVVVLWWSPPTIALLCAMVVFAYHVTPRSCAIHLGAAKLDVVLQTTQPTASYDSCLLRFFLGCGVVSPPWHVRPCVLALVPKDVWVFRACVTTWVVTRVVQLTS